MKKTSGIYKIYCKQEDAYYIGSSKQIEIRWRQHKKALLNNSHRNINLQNSYNNYGLENLSFNVVEKCSIDLLLILEQKWLDFYNREKRNIYNISDNVVSASLNPKVADKIGVSNREKTNILSREQVLDIINMDMSKTSMKELADKYQVSKTTITDIFKGRTWSWLTSTSKDNCTDYRNLIKPQEITNIIDLYTNENKEVKEIVKIVGRNSSTIYRILRNNNIQLRKQANTRITKEREILVIDLYKNNKLISTICSETGVSKTSIYRILKRNNIPAIR
tara:strand:- start:620 stop:1453 length:834 start_codon:yes stop_codon:yes gene_type:complete